MKIRIGWATVLLICGSVPVSAGEFDGTYNGISHATDAQVSAKSFCGAIGVKVPFNLVVKGDAVTTRVTSGKIASDGTFKTSGPLESATLTITGSIRGTSLTAKLVGVGPQATCSADIEAVRAPGDELANVRPAGDMMFNYVLTTRTPTNIKYGVILMPGGDGRMNPRLEGANIAFDYGGNFLIRSRFLFVGSEFVAASTDATSAPSRIMAIVQDLEKRYGKIAIYIIGTSSSTNATMSLAKSLDGRVAGFVHTSSMNSISGFDTRGLKSRQLVVVHKKDACRETGPWAGVSNHKKYGTELIEMDGGRSTGDDCQAFAYHGYFGIENDTVAKISEWIMAGK